MRLRKPFDPRTVGTLVVWLDNQQAPGAWSAVVGSGATQNATNNQPSSALIGSRPALSFDGVNDSLSMPVIPMLAWHAFAVVNPAASGSATVLQIAASGTASFTLSASTPGLQVISASGGSASATATYGVDSRVGAGWDGGALKNFYRGLIGEVLVYSGVLGAGEATAVSRYLAGKWGV